MFVCIFQGQEYTVLQNGSNTTDIMEDQQLCGRWVFFFMTWCVGISLLNKMRKFYESAYTSGEEFPKVCRKLFLVPID